VHNRRDGARRGNYWEVVTPAQPAGHPSGTEPHRCAVLFERAAEISRHQAVHLLERRALTSLVRTLEGEPCAAQLLRIGVLLEPLALPSDSADAREARLLLRGSEKSPTAIP